MEFINKRFINGIFYFIITIVGVYLLFSILPIVIFIFLGIWAIYKVVNIFKRRKNKFSKSDNDTIVETIVNDEYDTSHAVDVDFTEIK